MSDNITKKFFKSAETVECGIDGIIDGIIFGRIYVAAVILNPNIDFPDDLFNVKLLSSKRRRELRCWIEENAIAYTVRWLSAKYLDNYSIKQTTIDIIDYTLQNLTVDPEIIIGDEYFLRDYLGDNMFVSKIHVIDKGVRRYANIAAANLIAESYQNDYIEKLTNKYPYLDEQYGILKNKGHSTSYHTWAISKYGFTKYHNRRL
jgi:ribonuclease HII